MPLVMSSEFSLTTPLSADETLRDIDEELSRIIESARQLKSRRNSLVPISCLPPELLARIFLFVATSSSNECASDISLAWIKVSHICQHWREVAIGCPRLWGNIMFSRPSWVEVMLRRSKKAPLSLKADLTYTTPRMMEAFKSSLEHVDRTTEMHITAHRPTMEKYIRGLNKPAPMLESLRLANPRHNSYVAEGAFPIPDTFLNACAPNLRQLELVKCTISWGSPLLHYLYDLKLHDAARPLMREILTVLEGMPNLRSIDLKHCLPSDSDGVDLRIKLLAIKTIFLEDNVEDCVRLLSHLTFPPETLLSLKSHSTENDYSTLFRYFSENRDTAPAIRSLAIQQFVDRIHIQGWARSEPDPAQPFSMRYDIHLHLTHDRIPSSVINDSISGLATALDLRRLRTLEFGLTEGFPAPLWLQCFGSSHLLRDIFVSGPSAKGLVGFISQEIDDVLAVRRRTSWLASPGAISSPCSPQSPLHTPSPLLSRTPLSSAPRMPFPVLQRLTLCSVDFRQDAYGPQFTGPLIDALAARKCSERDHGSGPAEVELTQCLYLSRGDVAALEALVTVHWDGASDDEEAYLPEPLGVSGYSAFGGTNYGELEVLGGGF